MPVLVDDKEEVQQGPWQDYKKPAPAAAPDGPWAAYAPKKPAPNPLVPTPAPLTEQSIEQANAGTEVDAGIQKGASGRGHLNLFPSADARQFNHPSPPAQQSLPLTPPAQGALPFPATTRPDGIPIDKGAAGTTAPAAAPGTLTGQVATVSAYEPSTMEQLKRTVANSAIGRSLQYLPKLADALDLHPSEALQSSTYEQHGQQLIVPEEAEKAVSEYFGPRKFNNPAQAPSATENRVTGALTAAGGLTSGKSMATIAGTAIAAGLTAGVVNPATAQVLSRLASGGFSADMLYGLYQQHTAYKKAVDHGDIAAAQKIQGEMGVNGVLALLTAAHAAEVSPHAEMMRGDYGERGVKVSAGPVSADVGYRPAYREPGPWEDYGEGSTIKPAKVTAAVTVGGRRFGTPAVGPWTDYQPAAAPESKELPAPREVVQDSTDPEAIRKSAEEQEKPTVSAVEKAVESVPGAEVDGSRVKDADSQANKADRDKPVETQKDHLGVRVAADTPEAHREAVGAIAQSMPVVGTEPLDNNGLAGTQVFVETGKPGDANRTSEIQVLPTSQVAALKETDDLYDQQKKALAAGDTAKAEELGKKITEIHEQALEKGKSESSVKGDDKGTLPPEEKGGRGEPPEQAAGVASTGAPASPTKLEVQVKTGATVKLPDGRTGVVKGISPKGDVEVKLDGGGRAKAPRAQVEVVDKSAPGPIGRPLLARIAQLKQLIAEGVPVKIFTVRADDPSVPVWLKENGLGGVPVTNVKGLDFGTMIDNQVNVPTDSDKPFNIPPIPAGKSLYVDLDGTIAYDTTHEPRIDSQDGRNQEKVVRGGHPEISDSGKEDAARTNRANGQNSQGQLRPKEPGQEISERQVHADSDAPRVGSRTPGSSAESFRQKVDDKRARSSQERQSAGQPTGKSGSDSGDSTLQDAREREGSPARAQVQEATSGAVVEEPRAVRGMQEDENEARGQGSVRELLPRDGAEKVGAKDADKDTQQAEGVATRPNEREGEVRGDDGRTEGGGRSAGGREDVESRSSGPVAEAGKEVAPIAPIEVTVNHPPPAENAEAWKRASENPQIAEQFKRTGLKGFSIDAPYKFGLSEQGNINRTTGQIQVSANAHDPENTIAHEVAHDIYDRLPADAKDVVDKYMTDNPDIEGQHAGGMEERISDHFADVMNGSASVPENVRSAFFDAPLRKVERKAAIAPPPEPSKPSGASWDEIRTRGGYIRDSDDLRKLVKDDGDRMLGIKDVNGGRHLIPASITADLLDNPRFSGNVGSIYLPVAPRDTEMKPARFDSYTTGYLADMARGAVEARPDLRKAVLEAAPGLANRLPAPKEPTSAEKFKSATSKRKEVTSGRTPEASVEKDSLLRPSAERNNQEDIQSSGGRTESGGAASLQQEPAQEKLIEPDESATKKASDLGSTFYSGFGDVELFKRLFPDVAMRIKEWAADQPTAGAQQKAVMRQTRGEMDRRVAVVMQKLAAERKEWTRRSREDSMKFWNAVETGNVDSLSPKDQALAKLFKGAFDQMRGQIQELKPEALRNYIENYFPHLWDRPSQVSAKLKGLLNGKTPFAGKASFLKKRTIPTMQEGIDLGFKPKTWNPVESFLMKYAEMAQFLMGHQTLALMKDAGTAKYVRIGETPPEGWTQLDDRMGTVYGREEGKPAEGEDKGSEFTVIRGHYYAPADAARIFNNFVSRGLAGRSGIYDTLNWMNQNLNALQLGISAFHATTTTINAAASDIALGLEQIAHGHPLKAGASFLKAPATIINTFRNGSRLMQEYLDPGSLAKLEGEAKGIAEAGGRIKQNVIELKPLAQVINAMRNGAIGEAALKIPGALLQASVAPVMEWYVPRMKLGAFYSMAHDILADADKKGWTHDEVRRKMQRAWDSVDDRFGQVVYENLFWHKALRDTLQLAQRSVGWNYGTLRTYAGAASDSARAGARAASGQAPDFTPRMAFAIASFIVSGLVGAILTKLWTGENPQSWKDLYFPRKADGTRVSTPGYPTQVIGFSENPETTVANKMAPIWAMMIDAVQNRDFYGTEIRHKDDPMVKQLGQAASWMAKQTVPFSITGSQKLLENQGADDTLRGMWEEAKEHPLDVVLGNLGFQPAPAYAQNSEALNLAREYSRDNRPPGTKTQEQAEHLKVFDTIVQMYRTGNVDHDKIAKYISDRKIDRASAAKAALESRKAPIVLASGNLDLDQILNVYDKATAEEKNQLRQLVAKKYPEIRKIEDQDRKEEMQQAYERVMGDRQVTAKR